MGLLRVKSLTRDSKGTSPFARCFCKSSVSGFEETTNRALTIRQGKIARNILCHKIKFFDRMIIELNMRIFYDRKNKFK